MHRSKKGFTLVELCVCIAVISIVAVMAYSFLPLLMNRSRQLDDLSAVSEDMRNLENAVNTFILHYDNNDFNFGFQGNVLFAYTKGNMEDVKGRLRFDATERKIISESYIEGDTAWNSSVALVNITMVTLSRADVTGSEGEMSAKNILIRCSAQYDDTDGKGKTVDVVFVTHAQGEVIRRVEK